MLGVLRDITQRRQAEERKSNRHIQEITESKRRLEVLVSNTTEREKRMIALKQEVNELLGDLGQESKYEAPGAGRGAGDSGRGGVGLIRRTGESMSSTLYWLQCGGCGGDTMSLLNAESPDLAEVLSLLDVEVLWHPSMSNGSSGRSPGLTPAACSQVSRSWMCYVLRERSSGALAAPACTTW